MTQQNGLEPGTSTLRAWLALVRLSIGQQFRVRMMIWIALGLLAITSLMILSITVLGDWRQTDDRPRRRGPTYGQHAQRLVAPRSVLAGNPMAGGVQDAITASISASLQTSGFRVFSIFVVFAVFQQFLLPLWTLSFATDALGRERESRTMIWLLTRPMPRSAIYLAKYVAALPWCLGFNIFGFVLVCACGGEPGWMALRLYMPAVIWGTLAFAALFHLFAAISRWPAVLGLIYSFFFELLVGTLPGDLKRMSIGYYVRSLMYDATQHLDVAPDQLNVYAPVSGDTSITVLAAVTIVLTIIGMIAFSRTEYREDLAT
jgi:ABC-type transport system involved in multi-copper enzyme maturation permease subunit